MDGAVRLQIAAAINAGLIDKCNGVVKEGKEALVYHADAGWMGKQGMVGSVGIETGMVEVSAGESSLSILPSSPLGITSGMGQRQGMTSKGEESVGSDGYDVAVKVFKRISEFKGRGAYVDGDPRYHKQKFKNNDQREQVVLWAEKEYRNLIRANRAGVAVPKPLSRKENILFMRFLGHDGWPSPQLKEIDIKKGSERWTTLYCQTLVAIRR